MGRRRRRAAEHQRPRHADRRSDVALSGLVCHGWANDLNSAPPGGADYIILLGWAIVFVVLSAAAIPAVIAANRLEWVRFASPHARRDVALFITTIAVLFFVAHVVVFMLGSAMGGHLGHVRSVSSDDGAFRATIDKSHWLGEAHHHLCLTTPSPAPPLARRLQPIGTKLDALGTAATADLRLLPNGRSVGVFADDALVAGFDPVSGNCLPADDLQHVASSRERRRR